MWVYFAAVVFELLTVSEILKGTLRSVRQFLATESL